MTLSRRRLLAIGLLLGGLALAVGTPFRIAQVETDLAGYLLHPSVLGVQSVPYLLCAALWLFRRNPAASWGALVFAAILFVTAVIAYAPMLWSPGARGGDMIGLTFVAVSGVSTLALVIGSVLAALAGKVWAAVRRPSTET